MGSITTRANEGMDDTRQRIVKLRGYFKSDESRLPSLTFFTALMDGKKSLILINFNHAETPREVHARTHSDEAPSPHATLIEFVHRHPSGPLGAVLGRLRALLGRPGASWSHLGLILRRLGAILARSWGRLGLD